MFISSDIPNAVHYRVSKERTMYLPEHQDETIIRDDWSIWIDVSVKEQDKYDLVRHKLLKFRFDIEWEADSYKRELEALISLVLSQEKGRIEKRLHKLLYERMS